MSKQLPPEYVHKKVSNAKRRRRKEKKTSVSARRSCSENLPVLKDWGTVRTAYISDPFSPHSAVTFTVKELAAALGRKPEVVQKWIRSEIFPPPQTEVLETGERVYLLAQARHLTTVMGEHQDGTPYYRQDHDETRKRLFEA